MVLGNLPKQERIIAIGDLHGDINAIVKLLIKAGVIDNDYNWIGGTTKIVQVGDIMDRGREDIRTLLLLLSINKRAREKGGGIYFIVGNHEMLNLLGEYHYVNPRSTTDKKIRKEIMVPGSDVCKYLSNHCYGCLKMGNWVFVHGGLKPDHLKISSLDNMNWILRKYLRGDKTYENDSVFKKLYLDTSGLTWTRAYGNPRCTNMTELNEALKMINGKHMVVAHTPQENGINNSANGKLWRIDTGMSSYYGRANNNRIQALEIINDGHQVKIIK